MSAKAKSVETMSFEESIAELEAIVRGLEGGSGGLEASIGAYQRGVELKNHCEKKLKEAQGKIEKIAIGADGAAKTQAFDIEG